MTESNQPDTDLNVVKYNGIRDDHCCEIVCSKRFAQPIIDALKNAGIVSGVDPESLEFPDYSIVMTSTMAKSQTVKTVLKQWMIDNNVGDIASVTSGESAE